MLYAVAMSDALNASLTNVLQRTDGQEDVCFALYRMSTGEDRSTALISEIVLPCPNDREVHGNASINPQYVERVFSLASSKCMGVALLHSHPQGRGWQQMSRDDIEAESRLAPGAFGSSGLPLVGLTQAGDAVWSARFWQRTGHRLYERQDCVSVRLVGPRFRIGFNDALRQSPKATQQQIRTISAWGNAKQSDIARLRIAIVGCGSTGGVIAESLTRMGIQRIVLVDFDKVELHNLDRLTYASALDENDSKTFVLGKYLRSIATAEDFDVTDLPISITDEKAKLAVIDCDIIFCCVDRPWGRHILNLIGMAHCIPVIDGGILVRTNRRGMLASADWRTHVAVAGRACLRCLGQYDLGGVQTEREGKLDDPAYISGLPDGHPFKARENVSAFTLACASSQLLQFVSLIVEPLGQSRFGAEHYHFVGNFLEVQHSFPECLPDCPIVASQGQGDLQSIN